VIENFGPNLRKPQAASRTFKQTYAEMVLQAMRRLTVEIGILRRRDASEKLLASTTLAKMISALRSAIAFPLVEI
jgi:hypothetical protein